jgi:hypothetical protein
MGAACSAYAGQFPVIEQFNKLVNDLQEARIDLLKESLSGLQKSAKTFFDAYTLLTSSMSTDGAASEIGERGFPGVTESFQALDRFPKCDLRHRTQPAKQTFRDDFNKMCLVLTNALSGLERALRRLLKDKSIRAFAHIGIEVGCFIESFKVKPKKVPPFYSLQLIPIYAIRERLRAASERFVSVVSGHGTGKSYSIPLFLATQASDEASFHPFIIVIEHDQVLISGLKNFYWTTAMENVEVITAVDVLIPMLKKKQLNVIIVILTPLEMLDLIKKLPDPLVLFKASRFILDDMHRRSVETDLLVEQLVKNFLRRELPFFPGQFTCLSATPDPMLQQYLQHVETIKVDSAGTFVGEAKNVIGASTEEMVRSLVIMETQTILTDWGNEDSAISPGAMIVFLPNAVVCRRFGAKIRSLYNHKRFQTRHGLISLLTELRSNDTSKAFYTRVAQEIQAIKVERDPDLKGHAEPFFIVPIVVTRFFTESALHILRDSVPGTINDVLIRIVVTTGDGPSISIPDLKAVLDTGLHDVLYYDCQKCYEYVKEEPIPEDRSLFPERTIDVIGGVALSACTRSIGDSGRAIGLSCARPVCTAMHMCRQVKSIVRMHTCRKGICRSPQTNVSHFM